MADQQSIESNTSASAPNQMTLTIKTPKEKETVVISAEASVKELKDEVGKKFQKEHEQLCLIFAGKILKDTETLTEHGIKDGVTVHLVIKMKPSPGEPSPAPTTSQATPTPAAPAPSQPAPSLNNPFNLPFSPNLLSNMGSMGFGNSNFAEVQSQMQQQMMQNPDMLRQMMDNPMVQSLMSNPTVIRELLMSNPQMQDLMERNPEIQHMLNNPSLLRETMELARNPAAMQELMRHHDRALSNLESLPGGFNALQRIYRDVEEPMMNAARDQFGRNPFSALMNNGGSESGGANRQAGQENTQPLPNPWAPTRASPTVTSPSATSGGTGTAGTVPAPAAAPSGGMLGSQGMQSYLQQITQNPRLMESMMSTPYMQSMTQMLASNPELTRQIMENNPLLASNPELRENMMRTLPNLMQQLQNPEMQQLITNPDALQAIMQIQEGMQRLQSVAPGLLNGYIF